MLNSLNGSSENIEELAVLKPGTYDPTLSQNTKAAFWQKVLNTQKSLEALSKTGFNDFQRYKYTTAGDVIEPVRRACNQNGLVIVCDVIESHIEPGLASVIVKVTVVDAETGESHSATAPGYAEDMSRKNNTVTGDKAIFKSITGATKYALRTFWVLPSDDDPEKPNPADKDSTKGKTSFSPKSKDSAPTSLSTPIANPLMEMTTLEVKRLGWSPDKAKDYIKEKFGKNSRTELTQEELQQFLKQLQEIAT